MNIEGDLALDQQRVVKRERVQGEVDGPFDRVLDRNEAKLDVTVGDGVEHIWDGSIGDSRRPTEV